MERLAIALIPLTSWLAGTAALAHPGHGDPGLAGTWLHHLIEPVHLPLKIVALVAVVLVLRVARRGKSA